MDDSHNQVVQQRWILGGMVAPPPFLRLSVHDNDRISYSFQSGRLTLVAYYWPVHLSVLSSPEYKEAAT